MNHLRVGHKRFGAAALETGSTANTSPEGQAPIHYGKWAKKKKTYLFVAGSHVFIRKFNEILLGPSNLNRVSFGQKKHDT